MHMHVWTSKVWVSCDWTRQDRWSDSLEEGKSFDISARSLDWALVLGSLCPSRSEPSWALQNHVPVSSAYCCRLTTFTTVYCGVYHPNCAMFRSYWGLVCQTNRKRKRRSIPSTKETRLRCQTNSTGQLDSDFPNSITKLLRAIQVAPPSLRRSSPTYLSHKIRWVGLIGASPCGCAMLSAMLNSSTQSVLPCCIDDNSSRLPASWFLYIPTLLATNHVVSSSWVTCVAAVGWRLRADPNYSLGRWLLLLKLMAIYYIGI